MPQEFKPDDAADFTGHVAHTLVHLLKNNNHDLWMYDKPQGLVWVKILIAIGQTHFDKSEKDVGYCQLFLEEHAGHSNGSLNYMRTWLITSARFLPLPSRTTQCLWRKEHLIATFGIYKKDVMGPYTNSSMCFNPLFLTLL